jgi:hypothetical protein
MRDSCATRLFWGRLLVALLESLTIKAPLLNLMHNFNT